MKSLKDPAKLASVYAAASVVIGPLILILGYSFTRGGGDYCDAVYYLPDGTTDPRRITEFHNAQVFHVAGASLMLALGLAIIIYSFVYSKRKQSKLNIWATLGAALMMFGYTAIILISGKGGQGC